MSADHSTKPPSNGSHLLLLQVMNDRISSMEARIQDSTARVRNIETILMQGLWSREQPDTSTDTPQSTWSRARKWAADAVLIHKLLQLWKSGPWSVLGWLAFFAGKWLGVL